MKFDPNGDYPQVGSAFVLDPGIFGADVYYIWRIEKGAGDTGNVHALVTRNFQDARSLIFPLRAVSSVCCAPQPARTLRLLGLYGQTVRGFELARVRRIYRYLQDVVDSQYPLLPGLVHGVTK